MRAFKSVGGCPVVFDKVKGAYAWDVDGNKYIDYVGTWGPAILGHADDDVLDAVKATMDKGERFLLMLQQFLTPYLFATIANFIFVLSSSHQ